MRNMTLTSKLYIVANYSIRQGSFVNLRIDTHLNIATYNQTTKLRKMEAVAVFVFLIRHTFSSDNTSMSENTGLTNLNTIKYFHIRINEGVVSNCAIANDAIRADVNILTYFRIVVNKSCRMYGMGLTRHKEFVAYLR